MFISMGRVHSKFSRSLCYSTRIVWCISKHQFFIVMLYQEIHLPLTNVFDKMILEEVPRQVDRTINIQTNITYEDPPMNLVIGDLLKILTYSEVVYRWKLIPRYYIYNLISHSFLQFNFQVYFLHTPHCVLKSSSLHCTQCKILL